MCFIISCICVYYYDYLYVCYMLDIGERAIELMFSVYCHTDENKDYLSIYLSSIHPHLVGSGTVGRACRQHFQIVA